MTLRKGQKLINYLRHKYFSAWCLEEQDGAIRRNIFYMSDKDFDNIVNMSDKDCWEKVYNNDGVALSDKIMKQEFGEHTELMKDINKQVLEKRKKK